MTCSRDVAKRFADSRVELVGLGTTCEFHAADPVVVRKNIDETKAFIRLCHDVGGSGVKVRPNGLPAGVPAAKTSSRSAARLMKWPRSVKVMASRFDWNPRPRHERDSQHSQDHGRVEAFRLEAVLELQR